MGAPRFAEMTWPEVAALDRGRAVPIVPVGAVEAHGPHLPLGTDVVIAEGMAEAAADRLGAEGLTPLLLPAVPFTAAGFAAGFAGTISVPAPAVAATLEGIAASLARHGFRWLAVANAHFEPAHVAALRALDAPEGLRILLADVTRRRHAARLGDEFASGACHAGRYEGSLVMACRSDLVRPGGRSLAPNPRSLVEAMRNGHTTFEAAGGPEAYFGDPAAATAAEGVARLAELGSILAEEVLAAVREGRLDTRSTPT